METYFIAAIMSVQEAQADRRASLQFIQIIKTTIFGAENESKSLIFDRILQHPVWIIIFLSFPLLNKSGSV